MKDVTFPEVIVAIVLVLAACALLERGATAQAPIPTDTPTLEATQPSATELPVAIESPVAVATQTTGIPVTGAATVQVSNIGNFGPALVDGRGHSLYMFAGQQYRKSDPCVGEECPEEWSPLLVTDQPVAGAGVDPALLGTIALSDGSTQVTYNGRPLYSLYQDKAPGDAIGQGDDNEWYLISPSGDPIESASKRE